MAQYLRDAAVAYAMQYALSYNPAYRRFEADCANFVSQCMHAGGLPLKHYGGYFWYYTNGSSPPSWRGVDSMKNYLTRPFGNARIGWTCLAQPTGLKKGDIVFTCPEGGTPGNINRNPSHVVMVSRDVGANGDVYQCGHTTDQRDALRKWKADASIYIHFSDSIYDDFAAYEYADPADQGTAFLDFGEDVLKYETPIVYKEAVKNLQTRLNYLGFSCGTADGKFGQNTKNAVTSFQGRFKRYTLAADGKAGEQTKEALNFPKSYSR